MSDRFEESLRDALHRADLPAAPEGLHRTLEGLPMQATTRVNPSQWFVRAAGIALVAAAVFAVAFFGAFLPLSRQGTTPGGPATTQPAVVEPTATGTSVAVVTPAPTVSPTVAPTTSPTVTPAATGVAAGQAALKAYVDALVAQDYQKAWQLLGKGQSTASTSFDQFKSDQAAILQTTGGAYTITLNPAEESPMSRWLQGRDFASQIDQAHAVFMKLQWTALSNNNAGWELWVANPTPTGWDLYSVR